MCGIVGYVGKKDSLQILVDGLTRLEYRGYDSSGIAFKNGSGIEVYKTPGKLKDLQKLLPTPLPVITIGIGHTRWATHGAPSAANAHPHTVKGVSVVHNGIIENYRELRTELTSTGHVFTSQTDTEVVPQLIARYLDRGRPPGGRGRRGTGSPARAGDGRRLACSRRSGPGSGPRRLIADATLSS